ncbi:MAG: hypothetical protein AAF645_16970 [Myxococcota bacterium]
MKRWVCSAVLLMACTAEQVDLVIALSLPEDNFCVDELRGNAPYPVDANVVVADLFVLPPDVVACEECLALEQGRCARVQRQYFCGPVARTRERLTQSLINLALDDLDAEQRYCLRVIAHRWEENIQPDAETFATCSDAEAQAIEERFAGPEGRTHRTGGQQALCGLTPTLQLSVSGGTAVIDRFACTQHIVLENTIACPSSDPEEMAICRALERVLDFDACLAL